MYQPATRINYLSLSTFIQPLIRFLRILMATLEPELYDILAQLDFLVRGSKKKVSQDKSYGKYKQEVLAKIAKRMGHRYTVSGVRQKLRQAFRYREQFPKASFDLIFSHGSSEFKLNRDQRNGVKTHLDLIRQQDKPQGQTLHSTSLRSESVNTVQARALKQHSNAVEQDLLEVSYRSRNRSTGSIANSRRSTPKVRPTFRSG